MRAVLEILRHDPKRVARLYLKDDHKPDQRRMEIVAKARSLAIAVDFLGREAFDRLSGDLVHQGVVALLEPVEMMDLDSFLGGFDSMTLPSPLVMVDGVLDPRNLGALLRTCDAAGVKGVLMPKRRVAPLSPVCAKASAGAMFTLPLVRCGNPANTILGLKKMGYGIAALSLEGEAVYGTRFPDPLLVVIGSEEKGASRPVLKISDWKVRLPMRGQIDSLNLSVAAGIFLYTQIDMGGK
ncbi:MAG: 23S rRNA (guanosine(2251)-2'-O)-methyltransferase RlmB [Leptospirillum sp.]